MLNKILILNSVTVKVKDIVTIRNVNLCAIKSSIQVIYAPNGSGKSSLLNALVKRTGFTLEGDITIENLSYEDAHTSDFLKKSGIFLIPQNIPEITGVRYLDIFAESLYKRGRVSYLKEAEKLCLECMQNHNVSSKLLYTDVGFCSSGERRMMMAIASVLLKPSLCLFDETESGMDETFKSSLIKIINKKDFASIVVTHDQEFIRQISPDSSYTINKGIWNEITI